MDDRVMPQERPRKSAHDEYGREIPDSNPVELPLGFKRPEPLEETIRRLVRSEEWRRQMDAQGVETFEEAEDFDVDEDEELRTPFEVEFDPVLGREVSPEMLENNADRYREEYVKKAADSSAAEEHAERVVKKRTRWPFRRRQATPEEGVERGGAGSHTKREAPPRGDEDSTL